MLESAVSYKSAVPPFTATDWRPAASAAVGRDLARPVGDNATWRLLAATLDELDYGVVLLTPGMRVLHLNDAARSCIEEGHALHIVGDELRARAGRDVASLAQSIGAAAQRGMRKLLGLGTGEQRTSVSIVPLDNGDDDARNVLVVLSRRAVSESLSVQGFARSHALTDAETRVLVCLCEGVPPAKVALELGVAVSTIRTQIGSIRLKTGAESIRALVLQVAALPPVKGALRRNGAPAGIWASSSVPGHLRLA